MTKSMCAKINSDEVHKVRLSDISPYEGNRDIYNPPTEDRLRKLANSIKRNGQLEPLILSIDGVIISGNTRYLALQYLGRKFVNVRYLDILSTDEGFTELVVSANDQRIKSAKELLNEVLATVDPLEYQKRAIAEKWKSENVELKGVTGSLKIERRIPDAHSQLVETVKKILIDFEEHRPLTLRAIHYQILNYIVSVPSMATPGNPRGQYGNEQRFYNALSRTVTSMRVNQEIPFSWVNDVTRVLEPNRGYENEVDYLREEVNGFLAGYFRDVLQDQKYYCAIIAEKQTIAPMVNKIGAKYGMPVLYAKGGSSIDIRYRLVADWWRNGKKPIRLLFLSDLDPAGYRIQDTFLGSLEIDFHDYLGATRIEGYRVGVTTEQVKKYGLHSELEAKVTDTNYLQFVKRSGITKSYELEALPPDVLTNELEAAILKIIDVDAYNNQIEQYNRDIEELDRKKQVAAGLLKQLF